MNYLLYAWRDTFNRAWSSQYRKGIPEFHDCNWPKSGSIICLFNFRLPSRCTHAYTQHVSNYILKLALDTLIREYTCVFVLLFKFITFHFQWMCACYSETLLLLFVSCVRVLNFPTLLSYCWTLIYCSLVNNYKACIGIVSVVTRQRVDS